MQWISTIAQILSYAIIAGIVVGSTRSDMKTFTKSLSDFKTALEKMTDELGKLTAERFNAERRDAVQDVLIAQTAADIAALRHRVDEIFRTIGNLMSERGRNTDPK